MLNKIIRVHACFVVVRLKTKRTVNVPEMEVHGITYTHHLHPSSAHQCPMSVSSNPSSNHSVSMSREVELDGPVACDGDRLEKPTAR